MKTNAELQRDVIEELAWEPSIEASEIGVSVENSIVILNGTVKSLTEKWAAENVAQRVEGVHAVTDKIVVDLPGDRQYTDVDITRAAVNALDWNAYVPADRISVLVEGGAVTLRGTVQHHFQKEAAERAVGNLKGVHTVFNQIELEPGVSTREVKNKIEKALARAAQLDARTISVEAQEGKVILSGTVRNWAERYEAERAAWAAPGVTQVQNDVRIVAALGF